MQNKTRNDVMGLIVSDIVESGGGIPESVVGKVTAFVILYLKDPSAIGKNSSELVSKINSGCYDQAWKHCHLLKAL
jgi:hypothetical protein